MERSELQNERRDNKYIFFPNRRIFIVADLVDRLFFQKGEEEK